MANQVAFSNASIIDLTKDSIEDSSGTVSLSAGILTMSGTARAVFEYEYNTTSNQLSSDSLQLSLLCKCEDITTRYNDKLYVNIYITYYEATTDENGNITGYAIGDTDNFTFWPYTKEELEDEGVSNVVNTYNLSIEPTLIKKIRVEYCFETTSDTVRIQEVSLNYSITVSQAVSETIGFDISLDRVDWYTNGFRLTYANSSGEDRFYWNGDEHDNLNGINVNGEKLIYMETHNELLD